MNMQAVIADTQRGIAEVQTKIDRLLRKDVDGRALVSPLPTERKGPRLKYSVDRSMSEKPASNGSRIRSKKSR